ncbi:MAG: FadR family transcriptional regulator [Acidimicrobiaceae bacterium]|nr:FadR family transcriptional regulator [Acidimicrobiaceae bacterium]
MSVEAFSLSVDQLDGVASETDDGGLPISPVLPAYEQVAIQLQELIIKGTLTVGERLPAEGEMAAQFGVSRSTIREALRGLSSQRLVYTKRGVSGGTFVAEPSSEHVHTYLETTIGLLSGADVVSVDEILEARELFEVPAARLAAVRRSEDDLSRLRATLVPDDGIDPSHGFEGHREFHFAILKASGNQLLDVITGPVFSVLETRFVRDRASSGFWAAVETDHQDIFDAITAGDSEASARFMHAHLERLRPMYERFDRAAHTPGD